VEHGRSNEQGVVGWQDRLTPLWRRCAGGCHLNRPIDEFVRNAGFAIVELEVGYMGRPKVATFMYQGTAKPVLNLGSVFPTAPSPYTGRRRRLPSATRSFAGSWARSASRAASIPARRFRATTLGVKSSVWPSGSGGRTTRIGQKL
jgi:hypothetical protein